MFKSEAWVSSWPFKIDKQSPGWWLSLAAVGIAISALFTVSKLDSKYLHWPISVPGEIAPLAMSGGNPYLRALMRTISASEANDTSPYTLLYGGSHIQDLGQHPDRCIPIGWGPNQGRCTTAAGRYQFITTTWLEKAGQYHPAPSGEWIWRGYSFAPEYQDRVVYAWLADTHYWGNDLAKLLETGQLPKVMQELSGTWTSLGYGSESNRMTPYLAEIYQQMLAEELAIAHAAAP